MKQGLFILSLLVLPEALPAAILPETIGSFHRTASSKPVVSDQAVWNDYGLKDAETATYENGTSRLTVTAWQLQDTTGSLAAFQWQRPADAKQSNLGTLAAESPSGLLWVHGNYLLSFQGYT